MKRIGLLILILSLVLVSGSSISAQDDDLHEVTLFLSYIPSVQFAPIYAAVHNGYFAEEGIALTVENSFNEADGIDRIALNNLQFGIISGEQVLIGRGAEKPLVYIYEWYHRFPVGIVAPADSGITEPSDLAGKRVGIPGPFGASYMGFRALIGIVDLEETDLTLESIGFTAPEQVCAGRVEASVIYIVNEPLTIEQNCFAVNVIEISDYLNLVANGLVTNETTIANEPELVAGMVRALQRGILFTLENPDEAFALSVENFVLDLPEAEYETQRQVLENSLALWESDNPGATTLEQWETTQEILLEIDLMRRPLDDLEAAFTNAFLPQNNDD